LKPLQKEPLGTREVGFYTKICQENIDNEKNDNNTSSATDEKYISCTKIQKYLPKFYGVMKIHSTDEELGQPIWKHYIALEDLVEGFIKPCVIDIKIGAQVHRTHAIIQKICILCSNVKNWFELDLGSISFTKESSS
jgi:hypothetical protein